MSNLGLGLWCCATCQKQVVVADHLEARGHKTARFVGYLSLVLLLPLSPRSALADCQPWQLNCNGRAANGGTIDGYGNTWTQNMNGGYSDQNGRRWSQDINNNL